MQTKVVVTDRRRLVRLRAGSSTSGLCCCCSRSDGLGVIVTDAGGARESGTLKKEKKFS